MTGYRTDETWHRLREWTQGSADAERLAAQVLAAEGFSDIDPSHPLGGKDGGQDISCRRDGIACVAAVWFPRGDKPFTEIEAKFTSDLGKVRSSSDAEGFVFVANQELRLAERAALTSCWPGRVTLMHLERLAACLDRPSMHQVRSQFLSIEPDHAEGIGGDGGNVRAVGRMSVAIAGRGGRGGSIGRGGRGGGGEAIGEASMVVGGDGGDAGGADGRGGRGARGTLERDLARLSWVPTSAWGAGRGGQAANDPEYDRRLGVLLTIHEHYKVVFPERYTFVEVGIDRVPLEFVNKRLDELGEEWHVSRGEEGYVLPSLSVE